MFVEGAIVSLSAGDDHDPVGVHDRVINLLFGSGLKLANVLSLRRAFRILFFTTLVLLWVGSLMPVADFLCETLENRYPPKPPSEMPSADAILVLGGGLAGAVPPRVIPQLSGGGSRVWYAAKLWKAGKNPSITSRRVSPMTSIPAR